MVCVSSDASLVFSQRFLGRVNVCAGGAMVQFALEVGRAHITFLAFVFRGHGGGLGV